MKKIISSTILLILTLVSLITATYAWYTKVDKIDTSLDASTGYIVLDYSYETFDVSNSTYSINNVAFFDIDDITKDFSELDYLDTMASLVVINVENKSSCDTTLTFKFSNTKLVTTDEEDEDNILSSSYIDAIILTDEIEENDTLSEHLSDSKTVNIDIAKDATSTIYMYLYGVQEIDSTDIDFLSQAHEFSLSFSAVKKGD